MKSLSLRSLAPMALPALLAPLVLGFWQDTDRDVPKPGEAKELPLAPDKVFFGENNDDEKSPLAKRMKGLWKVTDVTAADWPKDGIDVLGYLLVSENFMSLEVQAYWDDTLENAPTDAFETFTAEYVADRTGRVKAQILMGSYIDRDKGSLEWYKSTRPRVFAARLLGVDGLRLDWADSRTMIFTRQLPGQQTTKDFYGNTTRGGAAALDFYTEPDIVFEEEQQEPAPESGEGDR